MAGAALRSEEGGRRTGREPGLPIHGSGEVGSTWFRISWISGCFKSPVDRESSRARSGPSGAIIRARRGRRRPSWRPSIARVKTDPDDANLPIATACCWSSRGSPLPAGATPTPSGINFVLLCRHGTAVWLDPLRALRRRDLRRDPARPAVQSHRRPLARPRRRPARGVLLRLPGRRPQGQRPPLRSADHPARPVHAGPSPAAGPGGPAAVCPAAA